MDYKKTYKILLILFIFSIKGYTDLPKWINSYTDVFPQENYISGMGVSKYKGIAESEAMKSISTQFKVSLKSNISSQENVRESEIFFSMNSNINSDIQTSSNLDIKNIKISRSYYDKVEDRYYVLATLNKKETARIYDNERRKVLLQGRELEEKYKKDKSILNKVKYISSSINKYSKVDEIDEKLSILKGYNVFNNDYHYLKIEQKKLIKNIGVYIFSDENKDILNLIKKEITNLGFKIDDNNKSIIEVSYSLKLNKNQIEGNKFIIWDLSISLKNTLSSEEFGVFHKKNRASQSTYELSKERAYYQISKIIATDFNLFLKDKLFTID